MIQRIYDQSPQKNHLDIGPPGGHVNKTDNAANASRQPLTVDNGKTKVYAVYIEHRMGYRIDNTSQIATGNEPETIYMVTAGKHFDAGCCFDYGNAETDNDADGRGAMEALYFGNHTTKSGVGKGSGPWIMADLEHGVWAGNATVNNQNTPMTSDFVFGMVKGGENGFALKGGDANGALLKTLYDGPRPPGYQPMKKQGAIILGIGGDNSNTGAGTFFEGAMTKGYTTDDIDTAVYNNIVSVKYGGL